MTNENEEFTVPKSILEGIIDGRLPSSSSEKRMARELLSLRALRDAGDEEVERLEAWCFDGADHTSVSSGAVHDLANLAIARGQQLREAQAEIATLTRERDEARKEVDRLTGCLKKSNDGFEEHERLWYLEQNKTEALTAELAALKSAPGMEEIDAVLREWNDRASHVGYVEAIERLADIARRSIASRVEVVGLLKWVKVRFLALTLEDYAKTPEADEHHNSVRILEIVEGE